MQGNRLSAGKAARATGPQNLFGAMREVRRQRVDNGAELKIDPTPEQMSSAALAIRQ